MPFMISKGMDVNAMFESDDDENLFIWIRRFYNDEVREEQYEAVYESEEWQSEIKPVVRSLIDVEEIVVHRARDPKISNAVSSIYVAWTVKDHLNTGQEDKFTIYCSEKHGRWNYGLKAALSE